MESREGVSYLLRAVGFDVSPQEVNLQPERRWKAAPRPNDRRPCRPQTQASNSRLFPAPVCEESARYQWLPSC